MTATPLYRTAAVVLVLFAAGHTAGFLTFRPSSPQGLAVWESMNSVHFEFAGSTYSYAGFYTGFGLTVTPFVGPLCAVTLFAAHALFSRWWLTRYRLGPLEWVWRSVTYWKLQPQRIAAPVAGAVATA